MKRSSAFHLPLPCREPRRPALRGADPAALIGIDEAACSTRQAARQADGLPRARRRAEAARRAGLAPAAAAERANALTDDECSSCAGRIDSLPAGAKFRRRAPLVLIVILLLLMLDSGELDPDSYFSMKARI